MSAPNHPTSKEEAIVLAQTGWWHGLSPREIVAFQLYEPLLCMDFRSFHAAVEAALGHPVWTHQFANLDRLKAEFEALR